MNVRVAFRLVVAAAVVVAVSGCATLVTIDSKPHGAAVYLDGQPLGDTPVQKRLSNFIGHDFAVRVELDGYQPYVGMLTKEVKAGAAVVGYILFWPSLLWCYGPMPYQYYVLREVSPSK